MTHRTLREREKMSKLRVTYNYAAIDFNSITVFDKYVIYSGGICTVTSDDVRCNSEQVNDQTLNLPVTLI